MPVPKAAPGTPTKAAPAPKRPVAGPSPSRGVPTPQPDKSGARERLRRLTPPNQHEAQTGKEKAASAVFDVAKETAVGAAQGAVAGGVGAVPGAVKGALKGVAKNKHTRNIVIGILAFSMVVGPAVFALSMVGIMSAISSAVVETDTNTAIDAADRSGAEEDDIRSAMTTTANSGIPWQIYLAVKQDLGIDLDLGKTREELDRVDAKGTKRNLGAGSTYSSSVSFREVPEKGAGMEASEAVKDTWVTALTAVTGKPESSVSRAVERAMSWFLGQEMAGCPVPEDTGAGQNGELTPEQTTVVSTIIGIAKSVWQGNDATAQKAATVAIATGMQESGLRNINYGDRDSVGVFQQRPQSGWGTVEQIMDPSYSAAAFFLGVPGKTKGLIDISGWESLDITVAAQKVQVSAFPDAYAKWEALARRSVQALWGTAGAIQIPAALASGANPGAGGSASETDSSTCVGGGINGGPVSHPLGPGHWPITSGFGPRRSPTPGGSTYHEGLDFGAACDTPIYAAIAGTVTNAKYTGSYGNMVEITASDGVRTRYAHQPNTGGIVVKNGDSVNAGQLIGHVGTTGASSGCHLHFETIIDGVKKNPFDYLTSNGVAL